MNTRSTAIKLLDPDVRYFITSGFDMGMPSEWNKVLKVRPSSQRSERSTGLVGLGMVAKKNEGAPIQYDTVLETSTKNYVHDSFALGVRATKEMLDDNLHKDLFNAARELGVSVRKSLEYQVADVFNQAYNTTFRTAGDGLALIDSSHTWGQDTIDNDVGSAALSISTFYEMLYALQSQTDGRGSVAMFGYGPLILKVPRNLADVGYAILNAIQKPGSADNDPNYAKTLNVELDIDPFLTDQTRCFLIDKNKHDLTYWQRQKVQNYNDGDFDTLDRKWAAFYRHSVGFNDARGIVAIQ